MSCWNSEGASNNPFLEEAEYVDLMGGSVQAEYG